MRACVTVPSIITMFLAQSIDAIQIKTLSWFSSFPMPDPMIHHRPERLRRDLLSGLAGAGAPTFANGFAVAAGVVAVANGLAAVAVANGLAAVAAEEQRVNTAKGAVAQASTLERTGGSLRKGICGCGSGHSERVRSRRRCSRGRSSCGGRLGLLGHLNATRSLGWGVAHAG